MFDMIQLEYTFYQLVKYLVFVNIENINQTFLEYDFSHYSYFVWYVCREMQLSLTPCSCAMENYVLYLSDICVHCLHNHFIIIIILSLRESVYICMRVCTYVSITMY